ncbi:hypothetical protein QBC47DRAFT_32587 [Echria macrotheca]|uniref:Fungal N-terminal domain-containing protein n=1 Tax=Echria macrotheca TaxID=438768 RepID=A0AAJ0BAX1_9PEZI|nr:hypothetical protein QBC47DRAFT_32587 [Echria macrotheca]
MTEMEVLGSIAAAVGLADAGLRMLVGVYGLAMDLKEVPTRLRDIYQDIRGVGNFIADVQTELLRADSVFATASPAHLEHLRTRVDAITTCAGGLTRLLESLLVPTSSSRTKRTWKAMVSLSKQKEILSECERIGRLKHDLQLSLQNLGILMIHSNSRSLDQISATATLTEAKVDAVHPKLESLHDAVGSSSAAAVREIAHTVEPIAAAVTRVEATSERIEALAQSLHEILLSDSPDTKVTLYATGTEGRQAARQLGIVTFFPRH